jgi:uncharacterized cupredoxin-like copper-binding protein
VALLGFGLYLLVAVLFVVGGLANGEPGVLIFALIASLPAILAVVFILRFGNWAYIFGAVISIIGLLFFLPSLPVGIASPDSFIDFVSSVVGIGGLIISLVGSAVAFFQGRSGRAAQTGAPTVVMALKGIIGAFVVLAAVSGVLTITGMESVSAEDKQGATIVTADKTEWDVEEITGPAASLKVVVKNADPILHTFKVPDLDLEERVTPGSEVLIRFEGQPAGTYEFVCGISGHEGSMKGTLTLR